MKTIALVCSLAVMACTQSDSDGIPRIGIARLDVRESADTLQITGLGSDGAKVASLSLERRMVRPLDYSEDVMGRSLAIDVKGDRIEHVSEGFVQLTLPLLTTTADKAMTDRDVFLSDERVKSVLARWSIELDAPHPTASAPAEAPYSACVNSGCNGVPPLQCCLQTTNGFEDRTCPDAPANARLYTRDCVSSITCPGSGTYPNCTGAPACPAGSTLCQSNTRCCSDDGCGVLGPAFCAVCSTTDAASGYLWSVQDGGSTCLTSQSPTLTATIAGSSGSGSLSSSPAGSFGTTNTTYVNAFASGTTVTLETANYYDFSGWSGPDAAGCSGYTCTFGNMTTPKSVTASYSNYGAALAQGQIWTSQQTVTITRSASTNGAGSFGASQAQVNIFLPSSTGQFVATQNGRCTMTWSVGNTFYPLNGNLTWGTMIQCKVGSAGVAYIVVTDTSNGRSRQFEGSLYW